MKKNVVILSGAGISKESGINTFRDSNDGLWNNYKIEEVATPNGWARDPQKVNDFYNERRIEVLNAEPNSAHCRIAEEQKHFNVQVITQNVDDLHERAGAKDVLHIHGEILKARSSNSSYDWMGMSHDEKINNPKLYDVGRKGLNYYKDYAEDGFPLRPAVVWFGETLSKLSDAINIAKKADILIVVGTSLNVYPAATLIYDVPDHCKCYVVDPDIDYIDDRFTIYKENATTGINRLFDDLSDDMIIDSL